MHYLQLIFVKADSAKEAKAKVEDYIAPYGNGQEWDWFEVGGRWADLGKTKRPDDKILDRAEEMIKGHAKDLAEAFERGRTILNGGEREHAFMDGYYIKQLGRLMDQDQYSNEHHVFDIETGRANEVPTSLEGYFVVVLDLHN